MRYAQGQLHDEKVSAHRLSVEARFCTFPVRGSLKHVTSLSPVCTVAVSSFLWPKPCHRHDDYLDPA